MKTLSVVHRAVLFLLSCLAATQTQPLSAQVIVAHRGASQDAPENTIAAFKEAWAQNADGIEGDFYVTKDQQIVCIHDANTERTAGRKSEVANSTLAELREIEYGAWKDPRFSGETIPTFAEVLAVVPADRLFVIELKTGPEIVPLLQKELKRLKPDYKDLLIIAFNPDTVSAVKRDLPEIRTHWLTGYRKDKQSGAWHPTVMEVSATLKITKADGLGTQGNREIVTDTFVEFLKQQGMKEFHVWTVDIPADARYFQTLGAIGITANCPAFIRSAIIEGK